MASSATLSQLHPNDRPVLKFSQELSDASIERLDLYYSVIQRSIMDIPIKLHVHVNM